MRFIVELDKAAATRAAEAIDSRLTSLRTNPAIGRPIAERPEQRELVIPFGNSGHVALYRHDTDADTIFLLAFRHQKEAGY